MPFFTLFHANCLLDGPMLQDKAPYDISFQIRVYDSAGIEPQSGPKYKRCLFTRNQNIRLQAITIKFTTTENFPTTFAYQLNLSEIQFKAQYFLYARAFWFCM